MGKLEELFKGILEDNDEAVVQRVTNYVVTNMNQGRKLKDVLNDPFVKNRLSNPDLINKVLGDPAVGDAITESIKKLSDDFNPFDK